MIYDYILNKVKYRIIKQKAVSLISFPAVNVKLEQVQ